MKKLLLFLLLVLYCPLMAQQQEYQNLTLCDEDSLKVFTYTSNADVPGIYFWSIDDGPPVIDGPSYDVVWGIYGSGWHTLTVSFEDLIGCSAEPVSLNVYVEICATTTIWAPNCFTPDGDANNNVWAPVGVNVRDPYFFIVNRWGNMLFESYDLNVGWDGTYGGKICQDGVYVYVLRWKDWSGKSYQKHGHITLLK